MSDTTLINYAYGRRPLTLEQLVSIAAALAVSPLGPPRS